jgi:hypothetical protein
MTRPTTQHASSPLAIVLLAILAGVMVTCQGYSFGGGNQVDHLPQILHAMDGEYLPNDFLIKSMDGFAGRSFYIEFLAAMGRIIPLPWVFLILTFASNIATALVTGLAARDLFGEWAGPIAICIVMAVAGIGLGEATSLRGSELSPQTFVVPLLIAALWAAMRGRPVLCGLAAGVATLFQPLLGLETGAIALAAIAVQHVVMNRKARPDALPERKWFAGFWPRMLAGGAVFGLFAALVVLPYWSSGGRLPVEQFIQIAVQFRLPHHYVPSSFPARDFRHAAAFLAAAGIAWGWLWAHDRALRRALTVAAFVVAFILLSCVGGYIFVELIPTRIWTSLQTFRMMLIVKWLGMALIAGSVARLLQKAEAGEHVEAYALLLSSIAPVSSAITYAAWAAKGLLRRLVALPPAAFGGMLLAVAVVFWNGAVPSLRFGVLLFTGLLLCAAFAQPRRTGQFAAAAFGAAMIALILLGFAFPDNPARIITKQLATEPVLALDDLTSAEARTGRWARANTPEDAVFLTPPDWGQFRLTAERAIVVDFKAFVWAEPAMAEWYQRLVDCYGVPKRVGFGARSEMDGNYRKITDKQILDVQRKYGIAYAVLYSGTTTAFPVVYEGSGMKIVRVEQ